MAALDGKKVYKHLCQKGFRDCENNSKDHIRIEFWYNNKLTRSRTKFSHNNQEINDSLIGLMSKQINLNNKQFIQFAECTMTEEEYIKIMASKNIIEIEEPKPEIPTFKFDNVKGYLK